MRCRNCNQIIVQWFEYDSYVIPGDKVNWFICKPHDPHSPRHEPMEESEYITKISNPLQPQCRYFVQYVENSTK